MLIAVDFDGTVVTHGYPGIGVDIGAAPILKAIAASGNRLVLWTVRSGKELEAAVRWFEQNGIPLAGVNSLTDQVAWSKSPKLYAQLYIDDAALGAPIKYDTNLSQRPFIDWERVELWAIAKGIIIPESERNTTSAA